jgi:hypothetical protein
LWAGDGRLESATVAQPRAAPEALDLSPVQVEYLRQRQVRGHFAKSRKLSA